MENPFRPGGELSQEADEIVSLIKQGKPITPVASPVQDERPPDAQRDTPDAGEQRPAAPQRSLSKKEEAKQRKKLEKEAKLGKKAAQTAQAVGNGVGNKVADRTGSPSLVDGSRTQAGKQLEGAVQVTQVTIEARPEFAESVTLPADEKPEQKRCCGSGCSCCRCTLL